VTKVFFVQLLDNTYLLKQGHSAEPGLKGQCHEMVVEIRQKSGRLCLNPFYRLKIARHKAMVQTVAHPSM
jgi:hypothetical protein